MHMKLVVFDPAFTSVGACVSVCEVACKRNYLFFCIHYVQCNLKCESIKVNVKCRHTVNRPMSNSNGVFLCVCVPCIFAESEYCVLITHLEQYLFSLCTTMIYFSFLLHCNWSMQRAWVLLWSYLEYFQFVARYHFFLLLPNAAYKYRGPTAVAQFASCEFFPLPFACRFFQFYLWPMWCIFWYS